MYTYSHPRPIMAADSIVFTLKDGAVQIVLIQRGHEPYEGCYALPGGFVNEYEPLDVAAARELREETGLTGIPMCQWRCFGDPGRDPRGWTVSVVYIAVIDHRAHPLQHGDDAVAADWYPIAAMPPLAFDHDGIVRYALDWLRINADRNEFMTTYWPSSFGAGETSAFRDCLEIASQALGQ